MTSPGSWRHSGVQRIESYSKLWRTQVRQVRRIFQPVQSDLQLVVKPPGRFLANGMTQRSSAHGRDSEVSASRRGSVVCDRFVARPDEFHRAAFL